MKSYDGIPIWDWQSWGEDHMVMLDRVNFGLLVNEKTLCVVRVIPVFPPSVPA